MVKIVQTKCASRQISPQSSQKEAIHAKTMRFIKYYLCIHKTLFVALSKTIRICITHVYSMCGGRRFHLFVESRGCTYEQCFMILMRILVLDSVNSSSCRRRFSAKCLPLEKLVSSQPIDGSGTVLPCGIPRLWSSFALLIQLPPWELDALAFDINQEACRFVWFEVLHGSVVMALLRSSNCPANFFSVFPVVWALAPQLYLIKRKYMIVFTLQISLDINTPSELIALKIYGFMCVFGTLILCFGIFRNKNQLTKF